MTSEEVIEEAAKIIYQNHSERNWGEADYSERIWALGTARAAFAVFEKAHAPTDDEIRLATLAALKSGAKSDAEAVRNYREAERVIRAAIPHLHCRSAQSEPSDAQVRAATEAYASTPQQHGRGREGAVRAALRAAFLAKEDDRG